MCEADEKTKRPLLIDPQPRRDLEVPPMISAPDGQGVASVKSHEAKAADVKNIFAGLDFSAAH